MPKKNESLLPMVLVGALVLVVAVGGFIALKKNRFRRAEMQYTNNPSQTSDVTGTSGNSTVSGQNASASSSDIDQQLKNLDKDASNVDKSLSDTPIDVNK